jgi:hypothetical protein
MNSNWGCFVCRKVEDGGFNTNPDYKERIRGGTCSVSYISSVKTAETSAIRAS